MIDLSKLQRRKVDMTAPKDMRTEDEKVIANVVAELAEKKPWYKGGICVDMMHKSDWNTKTFGEKCESLYHDTCYWM